MFSRLAALIVYITAVAAAVPQAPELGVQLTSATFNKTVSHGAWLVEHFSPSCSHCRRFAGTWERLLKDKSHLERLSGFHMAQVNCIAQGDLCNDNKVTGYPQLNLYMDGQFVEEYRDDRNYDYLSKWIEDKALAYANSLTLGVDESEARSLKRPNPDGKVVEVDDKLFEEYKAMGPVFVDFFAPWCGHCKALRPIYDKLGEAMAGKVNIIAVNCDNNNALCRRNGVQAFPTLKLFHHDAKIEYKGGRTVEKMQAFIQKEVSDVKMRQINLKDFESIEEGVFGDTKSFFLYLQNFDTTYEELKQIEEAIQSLGTSMPVYTSNDPLLYKNLSIANPPPTSLLLSFSDSMKPTASIILPAADGAVRRFINTHRFPIVTHLSSDNYQDLMQGDQHALVVLAATHPDNAEENAEFVKIARAWKRGGRPFTQPVWFANMDGEKWQKWLYNSYGIKTEDLPAVVVVDTEMNEFYDTTIEGARAGYTGDDVFSVLEGVFQNYLTPKKAGTVGSMSRSAVVIFITNHPFMASVMIILAAAVGLFSLVRCMSRDLAGSRGGYMNEKGVFPKGEHSRLD